MFLDASFRLDTQEHFKPLLVYPAQGELDEAVGEFTAAIPAGAAADCESQSGFR